MTAPERRLEVQRPIAADPATIFAILASPSGHVSIDASGMLMSAAGDPVTAVGDRFDVQMDRESLNDVPIGEYQVTVVIARYEQDRAIAWTIDGVVQPPIGHVYGYELEPIDGGTMVTSYYDWSDVHESYRAVADDLFPVISEANLRATLGILARVAAPGLGRPGATRTEKGGLRPDSP
jgi:Polyketide cyclase / dehydrase and lipid transport